MAQATFSIRMDEKLKHDFDILCTDFGMNASTAFNIFKLLLLPATRYEDLTLSWHCDRKLKKMVYKISLQKKLIKKLTMYAMGEENK